MDQEALNEELRKRLKERGESDLYYFIHTICEFGYNPDEEGPRVTEDQRGLCLFLQAFWEGDKESLWGFFKDYAKDREELKDLPEVKLKEEFEKVKDWMALILAPRDTLKSTVLQGFVLWLLVKKPDIRILLYGEVLEQAQKRLAVIKRVIENGKYFRFVYGDLCKPGLPWNENLFVSGLRKNLNIREGSVETAGLDVVVNSRHFDVIIPDDLHSEKNTNTADQIESVKEKVQLLTPLKQKNTGKIIVAGVFWNDSCVHSWLLSEHSPMPFVKSVYQDKEETISAYPHAQPIEELKSKREFMRSDLFACHFLMNPVSKSTILFPKEQFRVIPKKDFGIKRVYINIDPAGDPTVSQNSAKRDGDYVGAVAWGVNDSQDAILLDGFMERLGPTEAVEYSLDLILRVKPFIIGIERAGIGTLRYYLSEELRKRGIFAIIDENHPQGRSKLSRILELEPYARRRKMYIAEDCPIKDQFLNQITKVTPYGIKSKFDDLIDPTAYLIDQFKRYGLPGVVEEVKEENPIPPELLALNENSRWYWMNANKELNKVMSPLGEFFG